MSAIGTNLQWTDGVKVLAGPSFFATLSRGSVLDNLTLDLRDYSGAPYEGTSGGPIGAEIVVGIGRLNTTAISGGAGGIDVAVYDEWCDVNGGNPIGISRKYQDIGKSLTAVATAMALSGTHTIGTNTLTLSSAIGAGVITADDIIFTQAVGGGYANSQFRRAAFEATTTSILLKEPLVIAQANTDKAWDMGNVWGCWLEGGKYYRFSFDYSSQTGGGDVAIMVALRVLPKILSQ